uniref:Uncharacterized protein n=1 Tax=Timema poppense TaxID=170557 RepID=A0A7R9GY31_TIMPO|nr:unnamed protein product [Timema poppensis]
MYNIQFYLHVRFEEERLLVSRLFLLAGVNQHFDIRRHSIKSVRPAKLIKKDVANKITNLLKFILCAIKM